MRKSLDERLAQNARDTIALRLEAVRAQLKAADDVGALSGLTAALAELKAVAQKPAVKP